MPFEHLYKFRWASAGMCCRAQFLVRWLPKPEVETPCALTRWLSLTPGDQLLVAFPFSPRDAEILFLGHRWTCPWPSLSSFGLFTQAASLLVSSFHPQWTEDSGLSKSKSLLSFTVEWQGPLSPSSSWCLGSLLIRYVLQIQPICLLLEEPDKILIYSLAISYCHRTDTQCAWALLHHGRSMLRLWLGVGLVGGLSVTEVISHFFVTKMVVILCLLGNILGMHRPPCLVPYDAVCSHRWLDWEHPKDRSSWILSIGILN